MNADLSPAEICAYLHLLGWLWSEATLWFSPRRHQVTRNHWNFCYLVTTQASGWNRAWGAKAGCPPAWRQARPRRWTLGCKPS